MATSFVWLVILYLAGLSYNYDFWVTLFAFPPALEERALSNEPKVKKIMLVFKKQTKKNINLLPSHFFSSVVACKALHCND